LSVTKLFIVFAVLVLIVTIDAWFIGLHVYFFAGGNLLLTGLLVLDIMISPKPGLLTVRRQTAERLYFKAENEIIIYIENNASYTLRVEAKDEIPDMHFNIIKHPAHAFIPPGEERVFSYTVIPAKRGHFFFQHIHLRYRGIWGLCVKYARVPCPAEYKVYPNIKDISKHRLLTQRNRLLPWGEKTVRMFGGGTEYESLRPYVDGDDYRKVNWMATARENRLIVNQYQMERNQPVCMLLDTGRPMSYAVRGYKKLDYAINASLILSDIVNEKGDNSGLMLFDRSVQSYIHPGKGAAHRHLLMETLYHAADTRYTSNYENALKELCERQKRRALVFIFTDFEILEEAEELISHMSWLKKRHFPVVVFMVNEGLTALADDENDAVLRETAREFLAERQNIRKSLNLMGIANVESPAEDFTTASVNKYLQMRFP
jgi:uncharacterized protein (DUF58 family)